MYVSHVHTGFDDCMESAVRLKTKGFLAFTSYEKCYGVLDEQVLQLFSHVDESLDRPVGLRRTLSVKNATVTKKVDLKNGVQFSLRIEYDDKPVNPAVQKKRGLKRQRVTIDCGTADCCAQWFSALEKAARYHLDREERLALPGTCCEALQIPQDAPLSRELIVRQYRKLCLKMHPDRGGEPRAFADMNQAYNSLLSLQLEEDDKNNCTKKLIKVILVKGPNGVGLALSLMEDRVRGEVVVNEVFPSMLRHAYSDTSPIEIGDAIVAIGEDSNTRGWPLSRVRARLALARVPIGGPVVIVFERRVPFEGDLGDDDIPAFLVDEMFNLSPPQQEEQQAGGRRSSLAAARISTGRRQSIASRRISILTAAAEDDPSADLEKDLAPSLRSHRRASLLTSDMPYAEPEQQHMSSEPQSPATDDSGIEPEEASPDPSPRRSPSSAASQLFATGDMFSEETEVAHESHDGYFSPAQQQRGSRGNSPVRWEQDSDDVTSPSVLQARTEERSLEDMMEGEEQLIDTLKVQLAESRREEARHSQRASLEASHFNEEIGVMTKQNESYKKLLDIRFLDESQGVRLLSAKVLDLEARLARSEAERVALETSVGNMRYALKHGATADGHTQHAQHASGPAGDALQLAGARHGAVLAKAEAVIGGLEKAIKEGAMRRMGRDTRAKAHGRTVQSATKIPIKARNKVGNLQ